MMANAAASQPSPLRINSPVPPLAMAAEPRPVIPGGQRQLAFTDLGTDDAMGTPRRLGLVSRQLESRIDAVSVTRAYL